MLQERTEAGLWNQTARLASAALGLRPEMRLPLASLCVPALKRCSPPQHLRFREIVSELVAAEHKVGLFEYCLQVMLTGCLDVHFGVRPAPRVRYRSAASVSGPASAILSIVSYAGSSRAGEAERAFQAGVFGRFPGLAMLPREKCTWPVLEAALSEFAQAAAPLKRKLLAAVAACIAADGRTTIEEAELIRTIAASIACPVPPVIDA
jgi:hypothetical protein